MAAKRVAIVGAGPAGLSQLRAFDLALQQDPSLELEVVCFEKQYQLGGLWNFSWRTGLDEHAELLHTSMYRNLWSNSPKETGEYRDYSFEQHFGRPIASYVTREVMLNYINGRMNNHPKAKEWIQFNTSVQHIHFNSQTSQFTVETISHTTYLKSIHHFDYVIIASGHFSTPNVPEYFGFSSYPGRILHSHDFREAREFAGQNVLVIGSGYSAEDIALQCIKFGSASVVISSRSKLGDYNWPSGINKKPILKKMEGKYACFEDGSAVENVDAIFLCTGYLHSFPFLAEELRLKTENRMWPDGLYKGVLYEKNPQLFYLGMQNQVYSFLMFDVQAFYVRDIILKRILLPSLDQMNSHFEGWRKREATLTTFQDMMHFQADYVKELLFYVPDYPPVDTDAINQMYLEWEQHKKLDLLTYRDKLFCSLVTGNRASKHHTDWIDATDDTLQEYLKKK
uniref:Flavin-containing monooxygenase n=1 Tax=Ditylenchus dipsaci TaxID=166011 RepID=A0A915E2V0_9BILA